MSDLRLYDYAASCNCYKARLVLAQLGLEYERIAIDIFNGETLIDEYARINPARTTPVLETKQGYLPESNAILMYLAAGTPLLPDDRFERAPRPIGLTGAVSIADQSACVNCKNVLCRFVELAQVDNAAS